MFTPRALRLSLSLAMVAALAACGGGGEGGGAKALAHLIAKRQDPSGQTAPTVTITEALAALDTLVLNSAGLANVPQGTYTLDTTYDGVSFLIELSTGSLVAVQPESSNFDTGLYFMQSDPAKYVVGFVDATPDAEKTYACRSSAWSNDELLELASNLPVGDTVLTLPVCANGVSINANARSVVFNHLVLPNGADNTDQVDINAYYHWPEPTPETVVLTTGVETPVP